MNRYKYDLKMDNLNSHSKILNRIEANTQVLEIGTAYGHMTKYLKERLNCQVTGIDINEQMINFAAEWLDKKIILNVDETENLDEVLTDNKYDYIILGDVLEHCYTPLKILEILKKKIKSEGKMLISLPNVAHNGILMELLKDRYSYFEDGLLDYTHIRWYTQSSFIQCLKDLKLYITWYDYTYTVPEDLGINVKYEDYTLMERECLIKHFNGHVFQNIFEVSKIKDKEIKIIDKISSYNYDEFNIEEEVKEKYFIHNLKEKIEYILRNDNDKLTLYPTLRLRKYEISIKNNNIDFPVELICKNGIKNGNVILAFENHSLIILGDFKKDDKVTFDIKYTNITESDIEEAMELKEHKKSENQLIEEIESIKKRVNNAEIISFDIFDTLLLRNVLEPKDIFKIVEEEYNKIYNQQINFQKLRIIAEEKARRESNHEDILYDEIYSILEKELGTVSQIFKKLELKIEKEFLIPNKCMKEIFEYAKEKGKRIFIISDMYLPKSVLKELLNNCGYEGYEEIYVSSELKVTKATGSIYKYIRQQCNIQEDNKWCHIGDNEISDVKNAQLNGIDGVYYQRISTREEKVEVNSIAESIVRSIQLNKKYQGNNEEYWYNFGMQFIAPIYIGFVNWLADLVEGKDNIYFLARDGYIPHKLYNMLQESKVELPKGQYIYASRRGYQYPHLLKVHKNEAIATLTAYNSNLGQTITLKEIMNNIGLQSEKYIDEIYKFNISSMDATIELGESLHNVRKFLCHIWDDIEVVLKKELELLEQYFEQVGINDYETINVVDIGWRGSTQLAMKEVLEKEINGYYFGTLENMYGQIMSNSYGYAFDLGVPLNKRTFIMDNVMLYELIFSAPEKSLIKFKKNADGLIIPVLKNVENNETIYKHISSFQKGAIAVFEEYLKYSKYIDGISKEFCLKPFENFIVKKELKDLIRFSELKNSVGFGASKDCKNYVTVVKEDIYINNRDEILNNAIKNLWPMAILVKDRNDRLLLPEEAEKINNLKPSKKIEIGRHRRLISLAKKCIKDPQKAINRLIIIGKSKIR